MATQVLLPKLGLTMEEGTILEWVPAPGDDVAIGDVLLRLETDKVNVDVEAEAAGRFSPVAEEGATLVPGALIAWLLAGDESAPAGSGDKPAAQVSGDAVAPGSAAASSDPSASMSAGGATQSSTPQVAATASDGRLLASPYARSIAAELGLELGSIRGTGPGGRIIAVDVTEAQQASLSAVASASVDAPTTTTAATSPAAESAGAALSPLVRRHAANHGVDLAALRGSGLGGRIRRSDVDDAAKGAAPAVVVSTAVPSPPVSTGPKAGDVVPLTGMRGAIARNMVASLTEMAQLTHGFEVEVGDLLDLREQLKVDLDGSGVVVPTINDFVVRAAALALGEHPMLNASIRDGAIHLLEEISVGVAVAVPDGLMVPVVRDADRRSVTDIAEQTRSLATAARSGSLGLAAMEGATFVVSSLGSYGVDFFTPVVNPGNTGILGVGRVRDGVRWHGETPVRTQVLTLSLSFDHRAVDGAPAAEFLRTMATLLGRPLLLLAS